jgi:hypothetical protein
VCQQGTRLTNSILKLKITAKKSSLESVRQIIRRKPEKASGVRQPKKADRKMIGMGAKSIAVVRAVTVFKFGPIQHEELSAVLISSHVDQIEKKKLHGLSPRANYTDRATATPRRSNSQLLRKKGATWSA